MNDKNGLYQQMVLDHYRNPRNYGARPEWSHHARGYNPLCGDEIELFVDVAKDRVRALSFTSRGCAICRSSASMMSESLADLPIKQARELTGRFRDLVTGKTNADATLGDMEVFAGLHDYPSRVKCATLPWQTFDASLKGNRDPVTTE